MPKKIRRRLPTTAGRSPWSPSAARKPPKRDDILKALNTMDVPDATPLGAFSESPPRPGAALGASRTSIRPHPMNSARKRVLWMTLLLFGALLYAVLSNPEWRRFNPSEFVDSFRTFDWRWITVAVVAVYLTLAVRAWRWRILMRSAKPNAGLWNLFSSTVIGFGAIGLMGRPGEFVRPYLIARKEQVPVSGQLAVWVLERTFDGLVVLASAGIALSMLRLSPGNAGSAMSSLVHTLGGAIAAGTSTVIVIVVFFRSYYHDFAAWVAARSRFLSVGKRVALQRWLDVFGEGLAVIRDGRSMAQCFALSLLEWLVIAASYYAVLAACNCRVSSSAIRAVDLFVQRSKLIGSPAVFSSMMDSRARSNPGSDASNLFRPPPGRRMRWSLVRGSLCRNSRIPFRMVGRDIPVIWCIAFSPPRPRASTSRATYQRACDSWSDPSTFHISSSGVGSLTPQL